MNAAECSLRVLCCEWCRSIANTALRTDNLKVQRRKSWRVPLLKLCCGVFELYWRGQPLFATVEVATAGDVQRYVPLRRRPAQSGRAERSTERIAAIGRLRIGSVATGAGRRLLSPMGNLMLSLVLASATLRVCATRRSQWGFRSRSAATDAVRWLFR